MTALATSVVQRPWLALAHVAAGLRRGVTAVGHALMDAGARRAQAEVLRLASQYEHTDHALARELRAAAQSNWY